MVLPGGSAWNDCGATLPPKTQDQHSKSVKETGKLNRKEGKVSNGVVSHHRRAVLVNAMVRDQTNFACSGKDEGFNFGEMIGTLSIQSV